METSLLRKDLKQIRQLFTAVYIIITVTLFIEFIGYIKLWSFIAEGVSCFYLLADQQTLLEFRYTFWTLTTVLAGYLLNESYISSIHQSDFILFYLNIIAFILLGIMTYLISTPLIFPRIQWWVYDFRLKGDISVELDGVRARLSDVRRGAGCLEYFESLDLQTKHILSFGDKKAEVEIVTKRQFMFGRPIRME